MNDIVKHLTDAHKEYLEELTAFETKLCGPLTENSGETLQKFLDLIGKLEHHFIDEERIVFPELDKLPRKQPLSLAHLEHDDLKRIQQIATLNIERVVKYQGEQAVVPAANTACILIKFIKRHFMLEEEVIFPLIPGLREEQQKKILLALEKAEQGARP